MIPMYSEMIVRRVTHGGMWAAVVGFTAVVALWTYRLSSQDLSAQTPGSPAPIQEKKFVRIGGIEQWITINGEDRNNPVLLNLHGGPGVAATPFADAMFAGWERYFTLVQWDQRGAGRTYAKTGPSIEPTMTMDRMVQDGIEVVEYLRQHLQVPKIVLTGGSWGSFLGVQIVKARPELFYAYVGVAQIASIERDVAAGYVRTLEAARQAGDDKAIAELELIGPPPWDALRKFGIWSRWTRVFESKADAPLRVEPSEEYASEAEREQFSEAANFSQAHFFGLDMRGPLSTLDLVALGVDFRLPVFLIQGDADLKSVPEVTRAYFDQLQAPMKRLQSVPRAGHEPTAAMMEEWRKMLVEQVRPLAVER